MDETEEVLGCPERLFLGGGRGGVDFCSHSIIPTLNIPPPPENWVPKKGVATFKITQLAFAHVRQ